MKRALQFLLVTVLLILFFTGSAVAREENGPCFECHAGAGAAVTKLDFSVGIDMSKCQACHWYGVHDFDVYHVQQNAAPAYMTMQCRDCHHSSNTFGFRPAIMGWPDTLTASGWFQSAASVMSSPEDIHAIHANGSWLKDQADCASCHGPAACGACHESDVAHGEHASLGIQEMPITTHIGRKQQDACSDTYLYARSPASNYDHATGFYVGHSGLGEERAVLRFPLAKLAGTRIAAASLRLTRASGPAFPIRAYRLRRTDWVSNQATWNVYKAGSAWGAAGAKSAATDYYPDIYAQSTTGLFDVTALLEAAIAEGLPTLDLVLLDPAPTTRRYNGFYSSNGIYDPWYPELVVEGGRSVNLYAYGPVGGTLPGDEGLPAYVTDTRSCVAEACHGLTKASSAEFTPTCGSCHPERESYHGYDAAIHTAADDALTAQIGGTSYGPLPCSGCHSRELGVEHTKSTSSSSGVGCAECHPSPRNSYGTWDRSCTQGDCHAAASSAPKHRDIEAAHVGRAADSLTCAAQGCHEGDLAATHADATATVDAKTVSGCGVCHAADRIPAITTETSCLSCHATDVHAGVANSHGAGSTASAACAAAGCHETTSTITIHADRPEGGCGVCHANPTDGDLTEGKTSKDCEGCHVTSGVDYHLNMAVHVTPPLDYETCGRCHHGWGSNPLRGPDVTRHEGGCATCHNTTLDLTGLTTSCWNCHDEEGVDYHYETELRHSPIDPGSLDCARCHETTDVRSLHAEPGCETCHSTYTCTECHSMHNGSPGTPLLSPLSCSANCHTTEGTDYHVGFTAAHTYAGMGAGCQAAGCHENTLVDAHAAYVGPDGRYPQYADTCALCHQNEDPARIPDAATAECTTCHSDLSTDHLAVHDTAVGTAALTGTGAVCGDCHDANMVREHSKSSASSAALGCDACHPNPRSTIETFDATTCAQAGCHVPATPNAMHGDSGTAHAIPSPAPTCLNSECHASPDVTVLHSEATTTPPTGTRTGCGVCHNDSTVLVGTACSGCHPGNQESYHGDLTAKHDSGSACLGECHSPDLEAEHAAQSLGCDACHKSTDTAVRAAIDAGDTACDTCHGANHDLSSEYCTSCHAAANGTYAGATTYSATKHGSTTASTVALRQYPGTSAAAGSCVNCHSSHSATTRASGNQLCYGCHDGAGTIKPPGYSYGGVAAYSVSAHGASSSASACATCHAVHGASAGGTLAPSGLKQPEPEPCTGTTTQPGCHASGANAANGTNILAALTASPSPNMHHDAYPSGPGKLVCSSCHDPHKDTATSQYSNPALIGSPLPDASDRFRDSNGRVFALVGAQHDGVAPVITQFSFAQISASDPTRMYARWSTNENTNGFIDWGATTSYGNTVNSSYSNYTFHNVSPITFPVGTTWHYRGRAVDALGNTKTTQDYTYRIPYTQVTASPTVTGGASGTPVTITWSTLGACDTWVDYGPTTSYGSTAGSSAYTTAHSVTLNLPVGIYHLRARSARDIDSYTSADMVVNVYPSGATAPVLTPVPSDYYITGPKPIDFAWTQPNTTGAPFTYKLHVWDANSSPTFDYVSPTLTTNSTSLTLDGDHNYNWTVQAWDKNGQPYPLSATGTFSLYYYSGGSGSCPFLFTWDGEKFVFESDEFAAGKLGLNTSKGFRKPNPLDYHVLATQPVAKDGALEYKLVEERAEVDYLDQVKLYTVEAPADREIWVERSQAEGVGRYTRLDAVIHTTERVLGPPVSVTHVNTGQDVTAKIAAKDGDYLMLNEDRNNDYNYQTIEIDLGDVQDAPMTKLVIDGRTCIPTSVAGRQRSLLFGPQVKFEVQDASGAWRAVPTTNTILPKPPEFDRPFVLDLSKVWISDSRKVRFTYLYKTYFDAILLDTSADVPVKLTELPLQSAELQPHGFDDRSSLGELYDFVYGDIVSPPYYHLPGNYTKFGAVDPLLGEIDDKFVIFGGGDELTLRFATPSALPANTNRRFLFLSDGYYKDLKQTIDHTVEPLPFAAMSNFPYAETEHYPDDAEHQAYLAEWNTRHEDGEPAEPTLLSSLFDAADKWLDSVLTRLAALLTPESEQTLVASVDQPDTIYSVDTDRVSMNVVYQSSSTPVAPAAGWHSASVESAKPTPASPGTPVDSTTLQNAGSSNGLFWRTDLTTTDRAYNWQLMQFNVASNLLTGAKGLQLQWSGHGEPTPGYPVKLYLWDFQAAKWVSAAEGWGGSTFELRHLERQAGHETFCLTCHSAAPPAGASGATAFVNLNSAWDTDFHGEGVGTGGGTALKAPYTRGSSGIACGTCHDSHGNSNTFHIKSTINGTAGIVVGSGFEYENACRACHQGTVAEYHQQCDGCHYYDHGWGPTIDESYDCSACHEHGKTWVHNDIWCHCGELPSARTF